MGEVHRRAILDLLPAGGRMLEWGSGGSTVWFADHLPRGATLVSVEHDADWSAQVAAALGPRTSVEQRLRPASAPLGRNATIEEEDPVPLQEYVRAADGERFTVIVIDGYARQACLARARDLLADGGVVFLHDAQRPWYDAAKELFIERASIGSCPDYPVPHLWSGGLRAPACERGGALPLIVSCFTGDSPYEALAARLRQSCDVLGLDHYIVQVAARGSWEANCAIKAEVCLAAWERVGRSILWVDADAVMLGEPRLLCGASVDFAIHKWDRWQFASGTVFFNQTPLAGRLLRAWVARCQAEPREWDQVHLDHAWERLSAIEPLHTAWLPRGYCQIIDGPRDASDPVVIEHHQASRTAKVLMTEGCVKPVPVVSEAMYRARRASRPLRRWLPGADSQDFFTELALEQALEQIPMTRLTPQESAAP